VIRPIEIALLLPEVRKSTGYASNIARRHGIIVAEDDSRL
jgi:hypothetical protein